MNPIRFELAPAGHLERAGAAVTERTGGCSEAPFDSLNLGRSSVDLPERVLENEARVLEALGLPDRVARLRLEHGSRIERVREPGLFGPADALLTDDPSLVLWLTVADCFPVILVAAGVRMLGHAGWRGVAAGLVEEMATRLAADSGTPPAACRAWIGPGIGACCYPVGLEVAARVSRGRGTVPAIGETPFFASGEAPRLDLRAEIRSRLLESGLAEAGIRTSASCTSCEHERFFSHRRDGVPTGRMAAVLWGSPS